MEATQVAEAADADGRAVATRQAAARLASSPQPRKGGETMALEHCRHCQQTDRAKAGDRCEKSPTGRHEWIATTDPSGGSTIPPGTPKADPGTGKK